MIMAKSPIVEKDSAWTQTFITVTPQEDGFLREIEDSSVVSGNANAPLNVITRNIVLRRSLIDSSKGSIDSGELEKPAEGIATKCKTYLQAVPEVELPLASRDEATQTLYIGRNDLGTCERAYNGIINGNLGMAEPISPRRIKTNDATPKTLLKPNRVTKKLAADHVAQTSLSCDPKYSNSMITSEYAKTDDFCKKSVKECLDRGPHSHMKGNVLNVGFEKSVDQDEFVAGQIEECLEGITKTHRDEVLFSQAYNKPEKLLVSSSFRQTKDILLANNPSYVVRNSAEAAQEPYLKSAYSSCVPGQHPSNIDNTLNNTYKSYQENVFCRKSPVDQEVSVKARHLSASDMEALKVLKNTFCLKRNCPKRKTNDSDTRQTKTV